MADKRKPGWYVTDIDGKRFWDGQHWHLQKPVITSRESRVFVVGDYTIPRTPALIGIAAAALLGVTVGVVGLVNAPEPRKAPIDVIEYVYGLESCQIWGDDGYLISMVVELANDSSEVLNQDALEALQTSGLSVTATRENGEVLVVENLALIEDINPGRSGALAIGLIGIPEMEIRDITFQFDDSVLFEESVNLAVPLAVCQD